MAGVGDRPLLTFAIAAFNQERFIREAVEAAFAQTYSPLQIVLSDDCSEDGTFRIMQGMAKAYRGPHRLAINRNPVRKSIGGHMNRIVELAQGELIVGAAGDDVSWPRRTEVVYDAWEGTGRKATSIHSNIVQIDERGQPIASIFRAGCEEQGDRLVAQKVEPLSYVRTLEPMVYGCAHAFSPRLFSVFGELPAHIIHEDNVLAFRSVLAGGLLYINEALVKYRVHSDNVYIRSRARGTDLRTLQRQEDRVRRDLRNRETMYEAFELDLERARGQGFIGAAQAEEVEEEAKRRRRRACLMGRFLESGLVGKCRILLRLRREGLSGAEFGMLARRFVPGPVLVRVRLMRGCLAARCSCWRIRRFREHQV
jgi:glycosyltransferase involved in cell wall biosynthesis